MELAFPKTKRKQRVEQRFGVEHEDELQAFVNEALDGAGLKYLRVPDRALSYVVNDPSVPRWFREWFLAQFAGMPDNLVSVPIGQGLTLQVPIECKSRDGKLHGAQKTNSRAEGWFVVRTQEEFSELIGRIQRWAESLRKVFANAV